MTLLHWLDVRAYQLIVAVWSLFWPVAVFIAVLALLERAFAFERGQPARAWMFNLACYAWFLAATLVLAWCGWGEVVGRLGTWPAWMPERPAAPEGPLAITVRTIVAVVVYDFLTYWFHRMSHAVPALWVLHRFHHDERHLNAATSLRAHWLNIPLIHLAVMVPLTWLLGFRAIPEPVFLLLTAYAAFSHLNIDFSLGRFTRVMVGPRYHRLHHDRDRRLHDGNYAEMFPIWDVLFKTFHDPEGRGRRALGVDDVPPTASFAKAILPPVAEWWQMLRAYHAKP